PVDARVVVRGPDARRAGSARVRVDAAADCVAPLRAGPRRAGRPGDRRGPAGAPAGRLRVPPRSASLARGHRCPAPAPADRAVGLGLRALTDYGGAARLLDEAIHEIAADNEAWVR